MFKLNKAVVFGLVVLMVLSVLAGCGNNTASTEPEQDQQGQANQDQSDQQAADNGSQNAAEEEDIVQKIKDSGKLVMATSADYPPYEFYDLSGGKDEITGFDVDIAKAIAKELGVELEIKDMGFDGILPALLAKKVDIAISAFTITEKRKKSVNFSDPYFDGGQQIVTYKGSGIKSKEDLDGKTVGVQLSTTGEAEAEKIKGAKLKQFDKVDAVMLDLMNKRIDAAVVGRVVAEAYIKQNPDKFEIAGDKLNSEQNGVPIRKEDTKLLEVVNKALKDLKDSGEYDKLVQKWFVDFKPAENQ